LIAFTASPGRVIEPSDLAGILDQRQPGTHRCGAACGEVGHRCYRQARGRKPEHQTVGIFAHGEMLALAHDVTDVAEHEQIAGDRA
jgi:hypothetical protein